MRCFLAKRGKEGKRKKRRGNDVNFFAGTPSAREQSFFGMRQKSAGEASKHFREGVAIAPYPPPTGAEASTNSGQSITLTIGLIWSVKDYLCQRWLMQESHKLPEYACLNVAKGYFLNLL